MLTRYDAAYLAASPVAVPWLAWRWARRRKYRQSASGMLGAGLPEGAAGSAFAKGSVWVHAVSVGEVAAARAVMPGLRGLFPSLPFVLSTVTETGQEAARRTLPDVDAHTYFPLDFSWNVRRFLDAYRPRVIVLLEAEIWPNFLTLAAGSGARIFLLNARMSDRSFPRYRAARGLARPILDSITGFCAQTELDAERFAELGVPPNRLRVTGNCKFDLDIPTLTGDERTADRGALGIPESAPVIVAGSTHEGEEELILEAFRSVRAELPGATLILAPRHPERFGVAAELARKAGFQTTLASASPNGVPQVVVLDKMGVLARTYGLADVAIVAGSFCPTGGHNLLEAAAHGIPVVYGPDMHSQRELARLFAAAGAGRQVQPSALAPTLLELLRNPELRRAEGGKCRAVLDQNQGSAARCIEAVRLWMKEPS